MGKNENHKLINRDDNNSINGKHNLLEVKNLKKYFQVRGGVFSNNKKEFKAIDGISFNLKQGEILALVGESGCGKSTTGKAILRLIEPSFGKVSYKGKTLFDVENKIYMPKLELTSLRKELQFIFQDPYASLNPKMNVEKIICEGIKKHNVFPKGEIKDRCEEILNLCGLSKSDLNKFPSEFSGGQRQRIGIARALAVNPQFIVCDEPTAALDVSIQAQILNLMLDLKDEFKLTYLFISHNLEVVRYFCDNICVMYLGKIVEKASVKDLYDTPIHPYSKALISSVPKRHPLEKREKIILNGTIPSASNVPSGCRFHTRCPYCNDYCKTHEPELKEISAGHFVACHRV